MYGYALDYYDSAEGLLITRRRALKELDAHGVTEEGIADFFVEVGDLEHYDAQVVLAWLGY